MISRLVFSSGAPSGPAAPRAAFIGGAVLAHLVLLIAIMSMYRPAGAPLRESVAERKITMIELPPLLPVNATDPVTIPLPAPAVSRIPGAADAAISPGVAPDRAEAEAPPDNTAQPMGISPESPAGQAQVGGRMGPSWAGVRDPRLFGGGPAAVTGAAIVGSGANRAVDVEANFLAGMEARRQEALESRQITMFGRRVTVLGDSIASRRGELTAGDEKMLMPSTAAGWEALEMKRLRDANLLDDARNERIDAIRDRNDRERHAGTP